MTYGMNDRVREQVSGFAGGTGALTLPVSAVTGFQTFLAGWGASGTGEYAIVSGAQWEVGLGTLNAGGTTLTRTTVYNGSSGAGVAVNFTGGTMDCFGDIPARMAKSLPSFGGDFTPINGRINVTAAAGALTIAIKTSANTDPTPADPVFLSFRNATGTTGDYTVLAITAATSLVVSSGSTLGVTSATAFRLWVVGFNDAGTFRLGVINCSTGLQVFPLAEGIPVNSTAEGGAGAADSAGVIYTGTAVTAKPYRILGYAEWSSSGLTAGTWTTTNLLYVQLFGPGVKKPGDVVGSVFQTTTTETQTSSTTFVGTNNLQAYTPTSAANLIKLQAFGSIQNRFAGGNTAGTTIAAGGTALTNGTDYTAATQFVQAPIAITWLYKPNSISSITYDVRIKASGGTISWLSPANNQGSLIIEEIMG